MAERSEIECWLTDMDGVLVHENDAIPGASELLAGWEAEGIPYLVLTNNSIFISNIAGLITQCRTRAVCVRRQVN